MALSPEARHRACAILDGMTKKRSPKMKVLSEVAKLNVLFAERSSSCKFRSLQLVLFAVVFGTVLTLIYAPAIHPEPEPRTSSGLVDVGWIWERPRSDPRYVSNRDVLWDDIVSTVANIDNREDRLRIGLLNFNSSEARQWQEAMPRADASVLHLSPADSSITWESLYPEWIDEEEETEIPTCPSLPDPDVPADARFDLIAVKLPCRNSGGWSRDVARLHLQLAAAKLAVASARRSPRVAVLLLTDCFPIPNLFSCKHLVRREGDAWLYRPDVRFLKEKIRLPVGSCELSVPLNAKARLYSVDRRREAYATILHSADVYVCGAIAAAQSIRQAGSTRDLVILVDEAITEAHRSGLEAAGWKVRPMQRIRNPRAAPNAYNEWNYSKFRLWQLTDYDKVVFIDADLLVLRNIDFLFASPELSATANNATLFNSGVMVIEPSNCTFRLLMEHIGAVRSYNGGDQGYLNEIFTWWHRVPQHMNFLKHAWEGDGERERAKKAALLGAEPPVLYVVHYLGLKPWLCFRDYDCNWNVPWLRHFASDVAHARWWAVHDRMPARLRRFCLLSTRQKAGLEHDRRQAERENATDMHWVRGVADPRLRACAEENCDWEGMLQHWGRPSTASSGPSSP